MTEKRFYTDGQDVMQEGEVWVVAGGEHSADVIATALNELIEEINRLQFAYNMEILTRQSIEKENEQLKEELESFEQVSFTDLCDGSRTILYMKKENLGDVE